MIFDAGTLAPRARLRADVCVVGCGAAGATAAAVAAEAGLRVVVIEPGELVTPADMVQREEDMLPRLYWDSAGRTSADRAVRIHQGKGVGGSTLHNLNLIKRIPAELLASWRTERGVDIPWETLYGEAERLLEVSVAPKDQASAGNALLEAACMRLGWAGGPLHHNRSGCLASGYCELGCAYDAKNNAAKVFVPRAIRAGAEIVTRCQAVRIRMNGGAVTGVDAVALANLSGTVVGEVLVDAPRVCVAASATATAALLLRSGVPDPGGETGTTLRIHPALVAAGDFDEPVHAWRGIPQTYECTEHLQVTDEAGPRAWIVPAFAHPAGTATMLPGRGAEHAAWMSRYANIAAFTAMVHDRTRGHVRPRGDLDLSIDYVPDAGDRMQLALGLWACVHLLMTAGARRVLVPTRPPRLIRRGDAYDDLRRLDLTPGTIDIAAVHPMGSVPMGADARVAAVSAQGRHHHVRGLWVADGSLFPTSIGGPPQLSIYALGLHVGRALAAS